MIIDDDSISTMVTTWAAKGCNIFRDIEAVQSGRDGLDMLARVCEGSVVAPDVILLDLNMPVMNGFDFIEHFEKLSFPGKKNISIAILTSSDNQEDIDRAKSLGIEHYLSKSLSPRDLQDLLISLYSKTKPGLASDYVATSRQNAHVNSVVSGI